MIPSELTTYIETEILPRYQCFDRGHGPDHVSTVIAESMALAKCYPEAEQRLVYTIAAYHDLGLEGDRRQHHLLSGQILMADHRLKEWFTDTERVTMKEAVEDHRASAQRPPRSLYGCIVAEADRQLDIETTLRRTIQFGLQQAPESPLPWHYKRFLAHLTEKYAPGGYLKVWLPDSPNAERLRRLQALIADRQALKSAFLRIFKEESICYCFKFLDMLQKRLQKDTKIYCTTI